MKKILSVYLLLIATVYAQAQTPSAIQMKKMKDSLTSVYLNEIAKRHPLLRQGGVNYELLGSGTSEIINRDGKSIYKGDLEISSIRTNLNVPISSWGKNNITASVVYFQQMLEYGENLLSPGTVPFNTTRSSVAFSVSYSRIDSLFHRPVIYTASLTGVTNELLSIKRMNYTGGVIFPIKQTPTTLTNLGLILVINPNATIPIPYFSYWHKFTGSKLELNVEIPTSISLRRPFSAHSWVKLGTSIDPTLTFLKYEDANHDHDLVQDVLDLRTGLSYELMLTKKLVLSLSGGVISNITSRIQEKNAGIDDYFFKNKNSTVPFANFSLSFLPFLKTRK